MEARTVATLKKYRHKEIPLGRYNDRTDMKSEKTGFYYTRKIDGKWWTISPDGHPLIAIGINSLNLRASDRVKFTYSVKDPNHFPRKSIHGRNGRASRL
jgi:hypothetical protein